MVCRPKAHRTEELMTKLNCSTGGGEAKEERERNGEMADLTSRSQGQYKLENLSSDSAYKQGMAKAEAVGPLELIGQPA